VGALAIFGGQVRDAVVDQAADAFEKLDARSAKVVARFGRPQLFEKRNRHVADEAAVRGGFRAGAGGLFLAFGHF